MILPPARVRAPLANQAILAVPPLADVPTLVAENRRRLNSSTMPINGISLAELRQLAREEVFVLAGQSGLPRTAPLLLTGHQPELFHPGVWAKNFALHGLARHLHGAALNLIVDHDTMKSAALEMPVWDEWKPEQVRLGKVAFDQFDAQRPYEQRQVLDRECFETFLPRVLEQTRKWGYEPLLARVWPQLLAYPPGATIGEMFTAAREAVEREWGCGNLELPVSQLCGTRAFAHFATEIISRADQFRECHNAAVRVYRLRHKLHSRTHPVPELADGELPFWEMTASGRQPLRRRTEMAHIRPRALTLTLFARLCLGDFFIHGIGGGKYDEVTDEIAREFFGIDPPAFQVLTATHYLPLPAFPATQEQVRTLTREARDLHWNPQRHTSASEEERHAKERLAAAEPQEHGDRQQWFRHLRTLTEQLRPHVQDQQIELEQQIELAKIQARANGILRRRDYSWVLFPESALRPFMRQLAGL